MNMTIAFIIYQYSYGNKPINKNYDELIDYMKHHRINLKSEQILISGRACVDIKIGDILISSKGTIITIKGLHTYGSFVHEVSAGMTCGIFSNIRDISMENFYENEQLFRVQNNL